MYKWKITGIQAKDGLITEAKYHVTAEDGAYSVETEGHWTFGDPVLKVKFDEVTEEMVTNWIKQETIQFGKNIIESRLLEQLDALKTPKVLPPWVPQVFSLGDK